MRRGALLFLAGTLLALLARIPDVRAYPTEDRDDALTTTVAGADEKNSSFQDLCHFKICAMNETGASPIISEIALSLSAEQSVDEHAKRDAYKDVSMETFEDEEKEFQRVRRASKRKGKENGNDDDSSSSSSSDDDSDDNDDHQKSPKRCVKSKKDDDDDDDDDCDNDRKSNKQSVKSNNDDNDDHQKSPKRCVKSKKDDDDDDDCDNDRKSKKQSVKSNKDDNDCDDDDDDDDNDDDDDDDDDDDSSSSSSSSSSSEENKKKREKRHIEDDSLEDVSSPKREKRHIEDDSLEDVSSPKREKRHIEDDTSESVSSPKREKRRIEDDTSESVSSSEELKNQTRFMRGVSENYSSGEKNNPMNRHVGEVGSKSESSSKEEDKSKESGLIRIPLFRTDGENKQKNRFVRSFQDTSDGIISSFEKTGTLNRFIRGLDTSEESKSSFSKERNEPKNQLVRSTEDFTSKLSSEKSDKALFLIPPYIEDVSRSHSTVKQTDKPHNRVTRSNDGKKKKKIQKKKNTKTKRHCTPKATTPKVDTHETMLPTDHLPV